MITRELNKNKIIAFAEFYDISDDGKLENKLEEAILNEIETVVTASDLFNLILKKEGILKWKGALRIRRYFEDEYWKSDDKEEFLKEINEIKKLGNIPTINKQIVTKITSHSGIDFPIASTIVYFFSEGNCPIIDVRAVATLKKLGFSEVKDSYDWNNYFKVCFEIINKYDISFRTLDKALWICPDIEKNLLNCKKLNELNITCEDLPQQ